MLYKMIAAALLVSSGEALNLNTAAMGRRAAIAKAFSVPNRTYTPADIYIASGCSGALEVAINGILNPGDNLLTPKPVMKRQLPSASSDASIAKTASHGRCSPGWTPSGHGGTTHLADSSSWPEALSSSPSSTNETHIQLPAPTCASWKS